MPPTELVKITQSFSNQTLGNTGEKKHNFMGLEGNTLPKTPEPNQRLDQVSPFRDSVTELRRRFSKPEEVYS